MLHFTYFYFVIPFQILSYINKLYLRWSSYLAYLTLFYIYHSLFNLTVLFVSLILAHLTVFNNNLPHLIIPNHYLLIWPNLTFLRLRLRCLHLCFTCIHFSLLTSPLLTWIVLILTCLTFPCLINVWYYHGSSCRSFSPD